MYSRGGDPGWPGRSRSSPGRHFTTGRFRSGVGRAEFLGRGRSGSVFTRLGTGFGDHCEVPGSPLRPRKADDDVPATSTGRSIPRVRAPSPSPGRPVDISRILRPQWKPGAPSTRMKFVSERFRSPGKSLLSFLESLGGYAVIASPHVEMARLSLQSLRHDGGAVRVGDDVDGVAVDAGVEGESSSTDEQRATLTGVITDDPAVVDASAPHFDLVGLQLPPSSFALENSDRGFITGTGELLVVAGTPPRLVVAERTSDIPASPGGSVLRGDPPLVDLDLSASSPPTDERDDTGLDPDNDVFDYHNGITATELLQRWDEFTTLRMKFLVRCKYPVCSIQSRPLVELWQNNLTVRGILLRRMQCPNCQER